MGFSMNIRQILLSLVVMICALGPAAAQEGLGPLMPSEGGSITTAWANAYGADAESWIRFENVRQETFDINY